MIKSTIAAVCAAVCGIANAGELVIHTLSLHTDATYQYNHTTHYSEVNPATNEVIKQWDVTTTSQIKFNNANVGLGWRTDDGWAVGGYYNSYRKLSLYFGKSFELGYRFSVLLGGGTGYDQLENGHKITPIAALEYKLPITDTSGVRFAGQPKTGNNAGVIHAMGYVRF